MRAWLARLQPTERALLGAGLVALVVAGLALAWSSRSTSHRLRLSAGDPAGHRHAIAEALVRLAAGRGVELELVPTRGSEEALAQVGDRSLDAALVQGGLEAGATVREVAPIAVEPLHLLVRDGAPIWHVDDLRGHRVQLAPPGSGTHRLAREVMTFAGVDEGDFDEVSLDYTALARLESDALPDAIFHVSTLPSPIASRLLRVRGYRLLEVPYGEALHLRHVAVRPATIPSYTYGGAPPTPREAVVTVGTRMLLVAHRDTDPRALRVLLDVLDSEAFTRASNLSRTERQPLWDDAELPLHDATIAWLERDDPLLTPELMEGIESLRSFLVSLAVAAFFLFRWYRARRLHGLDRFIAEVTAIDQQVLELERAPNLDIRALLELRRSLGEAKGRALAAFAAGTIHSEELLSSFLTHVSDVRSHLNAMVLSERERLQKKARTRDAASEERVMRELWHDALDPDDPRRDPFRDAERDDGSADEHAARLVVPRDESSARRVRGATSGATKRARPNDDPNDAPDGDDDDDLA